MADAAAVPPGVIDRLRQICLALPEVHEEEAWVGTRWTVRKRNFAHVLTIVDGHPPSYAAAVGVEGPATVLSFRAPPEEIDVLRSVGGSFNVVHWGRDVVVMVLDERVDWGEVRALLTDSYCAVAPKKLVAVLQPP